MGSVAAVNESAVVVADAICSRAEAGATDPGADEPRDAAAADGGDDAAPAASSRFGGLERFRVRSAGAAHALDDLFLIPDYVGAAEERHLTEQIAGSRAAWVQVRRACAREAPLLLSARRS